MVVEVEEIQIVQILYKVVKLEVQVEVKVEVVEVVEVEQVIHLQ